MPSMCYKPWVQNLSTTKKKTTTKPTENAQHSVYTVGTVGPGPLYLTRPILNVI